MVAVDLTCNLCKSESLQSDFHLLECEKLLHKCSQLSNDVSKEYEDIFGSSSEQHSITKRFSSIFDTKSLLEEEEK